MKKLLHLSILLIVSINLSAQIPKGLVAHWQFNGNTADSSGNGLHGIAHNAVPATGINGQPNTAYYFNGTNAYVGVPYKPQMNLSKYTITATLQVQGFYSNLCQASRFLTRGNEYINGFYGFQMNDNPFDNGDCNNFDSTKFIFNGIGSTVVSPLSQWQYTPTIRSYKWYRTVLTFDSVVYKVYVNGQLVNTVPSNGIPVGFSTDSINIGSHYDITFIYPYWFKGLMDDMKLYNIVLSDSEAMATGCTKFIITQPHDSATHVNNATTYSITAPSGATSYQWQVDPGTGFTNITNTTMYTGINTPTLTVITPSLAMNNYAYRCIVVNEVNCSDTSMVAKLIVLDPNGVTGTALINKFNVFPNPTSGVFSVVGYGEFYIAITDVLGRRIFQSEEPVQGAGSVKLNVTKGVYLLTITDKFHNSIGSKKIVVE